MRPLIVPDESVHRGLESADTLVLPATGDLATLADLPRTPVAFLRHYLRRGFFLPVLGMALLIGAATALETVQPYFLGRLVSALADAQQDVGDAAPGFWFLALCGTWLCGYLFSHAYAAYSQVRLTDLRIRIQNDLFGWLHGHAPRYFLDNASGGLVQKVRQSGNAANVIIDYICANVIRLSVMFGVTVTMILQQAPDLLAPFAIFVASFAAAAAAMAQRLRRYAKAHARSAADAVARMVDSISNWDVVRSFARAAYERFTMQPYSIAERDALVGLRLAAASMRVVLHIFSVLFLAWLVWKSLDATRAGEMTVGAFTTIVTLSILVAANIRSLGDNLFVYFEYYGILSEGLATVLAAHEIVDRPGARPLQVQGGAIVFDRVGFAYDNGEQVFNGFTLAIRPGERVGLVGPSGSGKSTMIKLLRRQFAFQDGRILIDGQDIADVTWDSLHDSIAEVPQSPSIFRRTVRDNIRYSRPDAVDDDVIAAAKLAHCHDFVVKRPEGYDSVVGEKGMKLSGGERQRIAIARAFLKNAPILLLDEATSSLDSEAEHLIQDGLLRLMKGRTVIAIAHRLSTIAHLDRIVVLERGRIAEEGTHTALLAKNGAYAKLWNRQAGGFIGA